MNVNLGLLNHYMVLPAKYHSCGFSFIDMLLVVGGLGRERMG